MNYSDEKAAWIITLLLLAFCAITSHSCQGSGRSDKRCRPMPHDQAPGSIRCWSGGELVYGNYIYHNGGILCSSGGKEIKITGGKSLCIIESNQPSDWTPPTPQPTP